MKSAIKKIMCICMAAILSGMAINISTAASADGEITTVISENFENTDTMKFYHNDTGELWGVVSSHGEYGTGNAFTSDKWVNSEPFEKTYILSDAQDYADAENPNDMYLEAEFDIMAATGTPAIGFTSDATNDTMFFNIKFNSSVEKISITGKTSKHGEVVTAEMDYDKNTVNRIKAVIHITDSNGETCEELSALYVNGKNKLLKPIYFASYNSAKVGYFNRIKLQGVSGTSYFDNFAVYKYSSADGISPVVNKGKLVYAIRKITENAENEELLSNAKLIYEKPSSTQTEVDAAYNSLAEAEIKCETLFKEDFDSSATEKFYVCSSDRSESVKLLDGAFYPYGKTYTSNGRGTVSTKDLSPTYVFSEDSDFAGQENNLYTEVSADIVPTSTSTATQIMLASNADFGRSLFNVKFDPATGKIILVCKETRRAAATASVEVGSYEINKPYRVRIIANIKDSKGVSAEKVTAVYINGVNVLSSPKYFITNNVSSVNLNSIRISGATAMQADNIEMYKYVSELCETPVVNKDKLVLIIRAAINSSVNELAEAKNVYENEEASQADVDSAYEKLYNAVIKSEITTVVSEDFESEKRMKFYNGSGAELGMTETIDGYGMNKAFTASSVVNSEVFDKTYILSDAQDYETVANTYLETEFDIKTKGIGTNEPTISFTSDASADGTAFSMIKFNTTENKIQIYGKTAKRSGNPSYIDAGTFENEKVYRIRIVMHISDENKASCEKIIALYLNGVNVLENPVYFASNSTGKVGYFNRIRLSNPWRMYLDNLTIRKYSSVFGNSPAVNKGALIGTIRETESALSFGTDGFKSIMAQAKNLYQNENASQPDIDAVIPKLNTEYSASLAKIPFVISNIGFKDAEGNDVSVITENGTAKSITVTKRANSKAAQAVVALYNNGIPENIQMIEIPETLEKGTEQIFDIPSAINLPDKISGYSMKVFIFDSLNTMKPLAEKF